MSASQPQEITSDRMSPYWYVSHAMYRQVILKPPDMHSCISRMMGVYSSSMARLMSAAPSVSASSWGTR